MKNIIFKTLIIFFLAVPAFAWVDSTVNYRGEQKSWGETALSQDDIPGGQYWELTLQITSAGNSSFKLANWDWANQWSYDDAAVKKSKIRRELERW